MSTLKVNEVRHLSNSGTANIVLESNATTNLQATSTLGLSVVGTLTVSGVSTFNGNTVVGNASSDTMVLTSTVSGFNNFSGFTGEIRMYAGNAAGDAPPAGWLYCNGDTISSTSANGGTHYNLDGKGNDYQPLFNLLKAANDWGNSSSASWGTNTVKTPDFRSRSPVGVHTGAATSITAGLTSRTLSDVAGTETHTLVTAELASHTHTTTAAPSATGQTASQVSHTHGLSSHTHSLSSHTHGYAHTHNTGDDSPDHTHNVPLFSYSSAIGPFGVGHSDYPRGSGNTGGASARHTHTTNSQSTTTSDGPSTPNTGGPSTANTGNQSANTITLTDPNHTHTMTTANTGGGTAHTILSPIIAVNYIIKV